MHNSEVREQTTQRSGEPHDLFRVGKASMLDDTRVRQRKAGGDSASGTGFTSSGSGAPLPDAVRAKMERAFRTDFSSVRIFESLDATSIGALAFTRGTDIFFAPGRYQPETQKGQELLGHELAHVVQQSQGKVHATTQAKGVAINDDASLEHEADVQGKLAADGEVAIAGQSHAATAASSVGQAKCDTCDGTGGAAQHDHPSLGAEFGTNQAGCSTCGGSGTVQAKSEDGQLQALSGSSGSVAQRWPGDGLNPPGDCSHAKYQRLREAVETAKEAVGQLGSCSTADKCDVIAAKIAAMTTEIAARVALDSTCFRGGNTTHRQQVQDKINAVNRCYRHFEGKNCDDRLKQLTANVAEAARQAGDATAEGARRAAEAAQQVFDRIGGAFGAVIGVLLAVIRFLLGPAWAT